MVINTISYWILGFPIAFLAARVFFLEPKFIWTGLVLGLTVSAVLLTARFRKISRLMA
jgi:MATE family multidrug resistance protein